MCFDLHSLVVAAVREEPVNVGLTSAKLYSVLKCCGCCQMHHLHPVKGCTTAVIQIADTGLSALLWTIFCCVYTQRVPRYPSGTRMESRVCRQNNYRLSKVRKAQLNPVLNYTLLIHFLKSNYIYIYFHLKSALKTKSKKELNNLPIHVNIFLFSL